MSIKFRRPVGATADAMELEYVSALMQTDMPDLRPDGSIRDVDLVHYLNSRHGIRTTAQEVREVVLSGLTATAGTWARGYKQDGSIDLMECAAILLIPTLMKASKDAGGRGGNDVGEFGGESDVSKVVKVGKGIELSIISDKTGRTLTTSSTHSVSVGTARGAEKRLTNEDVARGENESKSDSPSIKLEWEEDGDGLHPPKDLIRRALKVILEDATGGHHSPTLNHNLLRRILRTYGEYELSEDDEVLGSMIDAAGGVREGDCQGHDREDSKDIDDLDGALCEEGGLMLDAEAFARALTSDVGIYQEDCDEKLSTNFYDVFKTNCAVCSNDNDEPSYIDLDTTLHTDTVSIAEENKFIRHVKTECTAPSIDFSAGTYGCKLLTVTLWTAFVVGYRGYVYKKTMSDEYFDRCLKIVGGVDGGGGWDTFGCRLGVSAAKWLAAFFIAWAYGLTFVGLGSIGNDIESMNKIKPWVGIIAILLQVALPFELMGKDEIPNQYPEDRIWIGTYFFLGVAACLMQMVNVVHRLIPPKVFERKPFWKELFTPGSVRAESQLKQAAAWKVNQMTKNALDLMEVRHRVGVTDSHYGQGLMAFSKQGEQYEVVNACFSWTWRRIRNQELFLKEGIWLNARLLAGCVAMVVTAISILTQGIRLTITLGEEFDKGNLSSGTYQAVTERLVAGHQKIGEDISAKAIMYAKKVIEETILSECNEKAEIELASYEQDIHLAVADVAEEAAEDLYPTERYMVVVPMAVGTCVAFLVAASLTFLYIPSVVSTALKLRSGVIPTFRDRDFSRHRSDVELVTILLGSMVWGTFFSALVVGGMVGALIFFLVWQVTEPLVMRSLSFLAGISIVILLRMALFYSLRETFYVSFYRRIPQLVNVVALSIEAANFAVSVGYIIVRSIKLLVTTALYIGRIDTPLLAPGVGYGLDNYPNIFLKDILAHEAHRHPYIELIGKMFMMKLRYGENFGSTAGSCWRLIFVYALMPWLSKYRIMTKSNERNFDDSSKRDLELSETVTRKSLVSMDQCRLFSSVKQHDFDAAAVDEVLPSDSTSEEKLLWFEKKTARLECQLSELKDRLRVDDIKHHRCLLVKESGEKAEEDNRKPDLGMPKVEIN